MNLETRLADLLGGAWAILPRSFDALLAAAMRPMPEARVGAASGAAGVAAGYTIANGKAHIPVTGIILKAVPEWLSRWGIEATGTEAVRGAIRNALADESVQSIQLDVDSPGGTVSGVQELADDVAAVTAKPITASVSDLAASAAYWIASQADHIEANEGAQVGSIGVFTAIRDFSKAFEDEGIKTHVISSHELKGVGVAGAKVTDAQIADIQRNVNDIAAMFNAAVSRGRGLSAAAVAQSATGQVWMAREAMARGLIDKVRTQTTPHVAEAPAMDQPRAGQEEQKMDPKLEVATAPVANEELAKARAEADAAKAQAMAAAAQVETLKAERRDAAIKAHADRVSPAIMEAVRKLGASMEPAEFDKYLESLPVVVRAERESVVPTNVSREAVYQEVAAEKSLAKVMQTSVPHSQELAVLGDAVAFVDASGKAHLKDGRVMDRVELKKEFGFKHVLFSVAMLVGLLFGANAGAAALSASRATECKGGSTKSYLMLASETIYSGSMVMVNSAGTVESAAASASNNGVVGVAQETKTSASSGSYWIKVTSDAVCKFAGLSLAQTAVGELMYAQDDQTVDETAGANQPIAGLLVQFDSSTVGWVLISPYLVPQVASTADPLTLTGDLTLSGGAGAATFTDSASSIVLLDNDTTSLLIGSTDQLDLITIDTGNNTETVIVTGTTGQEAFNVAVGTSTFVETVALTANLTVGTTLGVTGDITASGGAGGLTFSGSAASIVVDDADSTALLLGSSGHLDLLTIDTTDDQETVIVTGETAVMAFQVATGTSTFAEAATFTAGDIVSDNGTGCFGSSSDACFEYDTAQTADALMLGVSTDSEAVIVCQKADASVDFGHADQTNPTVYVHASDAADTTKWVSLAHDGTNGVLDVGAGVVTMPDGAMIADAKSVCFGSSSDACFEYDTDQGPDSFALWVSADSNAIIMAQKADQGTDFTHADATNPTLFIQSADSTTVADYISLSHNQTDAHIITGAGDIHLEPNGADVAITGTLTVSAGLVTSVLEANLTAGACTAGTWKVDNNATRELCRCNDAGSAYDCVSATTANGPTD